MYKIHPNTVQVTGGNGQTIAKNDQNRSESDSKSDEIIILDAMGTNIMSEGYSATSNANDNNYQASAKDAAVVMNDIVNFKQAPK